MRVTADQSGKWQLLRRWGRDYFQSRDEAVQAGLRLARTRRFRRLVIEREDGSTQEEIYFW